MDYLLLRYWKSIQRLNPFYEPSSFETKNWRIWNQKTHNLPHEESQQNLLLIEYQRVKYFEECDC